MMYKLEEFNKKSYAKIGAQEIELLRITKIALFSSEKKVDVNAYKDVINIAQKHGLEILLYSAMSRKVNTETKNLRDCVLRQQLFYDRVIKEMFRVCNSLDQNDIEYVVLKGMSVALYYPNPRFRAMGDIDILVSKEDLGKSHQVMIELGYKEKRSDYPYGIHIEYEKDGVEVELHFRYIRHYHERQNQILTPYINSGFRNRIYKEYEGRKFSSLPVEEEGIVLLYHVFDHLQYGIGLRQIIDWMMFVANSGLEDWDSFNAVSKEAELFALQKVLTRICEIYLGLPHRPDIDWCSDADEELCEQLMEYIIEQGNFGRGIDEDDASVKAKHFKGIIPAFQRLQKGGMARWKATQNYAVLRPFAWMYQAGRLAKLSLEKDHPLYTFKGDMRKAHETEVMLKKLGIINL